MINGIINVYKEAGFTSFDVVAKMRRILGTKKIGHTGTLDPDAVGVLPVCVGNATKLVDMLTDDTKEYVALMRLGVTTDTQDMSGTVMSTDWEGALKLDESVVAEAILSFKGEIMQVPPMYSALKVNGQKLCDLARKGIEVERKPRKVRIDEIEILGHDIHEDASTSYVNHKIRVVCSKGTYIRTLIHDIGQKIGCGAAMEHLERTRVGRFKKDEAHTLKEIEELTDGLHNIIIPTDVYLDFYPAIHVLEDGMKYLNNGNILYPEQTDRKEFNDGQVYRIYSYDNQFQAVYSFDAKRKLLVPVKMFF